jgi:hypothetical protein
MKKSATEELNEAIQILQRKQHIELGILKEQFLITYESLKPINLIKSTFQEVTEMPGIKIMIINKLIDLTIGLLGKNVLAGESASPIKKMIGVILKTAINKLVSKSPSSSLSMTPQ